MSSLETSLTAPGCICVSTRAYLRWHLFLRGPGKIREALRWSGGRFLFFVPMRQFQCRVADGRRKSCDCKNKTDERVTDGETYESTTLLHSAGCLRP